jgi:1-acyl-sn-glycerol-3-phosphate acyltransferase
MVARRANRTALPQRTSTVTDHRTKHRQLVPNSGVRDHAYRAVIAVVKGFFALTNIRFDIRGAHHLPSSGPAVIASNHISYLDFTFLGLAADRHGRRIRFMAKGSLFRLPVIGPLMRAMGHIPVERVTGAGAYRHAYRALADGQLVGVFPEATISRAWTLKPFKKGAARLAVEQRVPLVPTATWGGQRLLTVDGRHTLRRGIPVMIYIGEPIHPRPWQSIEEVNELLRVAMGELLDAAQRDYPERPATLRDRWWLPRHLGGSAPDPVDAAVIDAARVRL